MHVRHEVVYKCAIDDYAFSRAFIRTLSCFVSFCFSGVWVIHLTHK